MTKDASALNFLGPEFLSWLYFYLDEKGGEIRFSQLSSKKVNFEDTFRMCVGNRAALRPINGSRASVTVSGQAVDDSGEVLQAFRSGALVDALALEIHFSQSVYSFSVSADASISNFKSVQPFAEKSSSQFTLEDEHGNEKEDAQELEDEAQLLIRMAALDEVETILDALYEQFLERRLHQAFVTQDLANMRRSVSEGLQSKLPPVDRNEGAKKSSHTLLEQSVV